MAGSSDKKSKDKPDKRILGDEWLGWDGDVSKVETEIREGKGKFLAVTLLIWALCAAALVAFLYLAYPRFVEWHPALAHGIGGVFLGVIGLFLAVEALFIASAVTERKLYLSGRLGRRYLVWMAYRALRLGRLFGFSRDRMGASFVAVANALMGRMSAPGGTVLILLPRCLRKDVLDEVRKLSDEYECVAKVVSGGEAARKHVREIRPSGVVGVACERDLVSGIHDVAPTIPVVGVANRRPEGPCRNTQVDLEELERVLANFTGRGRTEAGVEKK